MTIRAILTLVALGALAVACSAAPAVGKGVTIQWLGHASFLITSAEGLRVVTDPFPAGLGYPLAHPAADVVLVSHEHFDHSAVGEVRGDHPNIVRFGGRSGAMPTQHIVFKGVEAVHYSSEADANRGMVTVFVFNLDGVRFCHLGDLGGALAPEQVKAIGPVDVLMIPTGEIGRAHV